VDARVEPAPAHAERRHNRAVHRPDERAAALPDGSVEGLAGALERRLDARLLLLERGEVALERNAAVVHLGERAALVGACRRELVARTHQLLLDGRDLVAL